MCMVHASSTAAFFFFSPADQSKYESLSEDDVLELLNMSSLTVENFDSVKSSVCRSMN